MGIEKCGPFLFFVWEDKLGEGKGMGFNRTGLCSSKNHGEDGD